MDGLKLIVGLGNPGPQYLRSRHNIGFWFVDVLAQGSGAAWRRDAKLHGMEATVQVADRAVRLLKPDTFMNASGEAVAAALRYYRIEADQCLVVHDDLDLSPGSVRLKFAGGAGGHNGLRDIIRHLGHERFHRLRIGIGHPPSRNAVIDWVLARPAEGDEAAILGALARALDVLPLTVAGEFDRAMQTLHTPPPAGTD